MRKQARVFPWTQVADDINPPPRKLPPKKDALSEQLVADPIAEIVAKGLVSGKIAARTVTGEKLTPPKTIKALSGVYVSPADVNRALEQEGSLSRWHPKANRTESVSEAKTNEPWEPRVRAEATQRTTDLLRRTGHAGSMRELGRYLSRWAAQEKIQTSWHTTPNPRTIENMLRKTGWQMPS